jgi:hypothetical protein
MSLLTELGMTVTLQATKMSPLAGLRLSDEAVEFGLAATKMSLLTELGMIVTLRTTKMSPLAGLRVARAYPIVNQCFMP